MQNEMFTFVQCSHVGHEVAYKYCNRRDADQHFDRLVRDLHPQEGMFVAYYCASVGGLVNAHYR